MSSSVSLIALIFILGSAIASPALADDAPPWVEAMRNVHHRYSGRRGSFAEFGDSITYTQAFWTSLQWEHRKFDSDTQAVYGRIQKYTLAECWRWKGEKFGNESGKTSAWAVQHVDQWLKDLDPEVVVIMFGTNDLTQLSVEQHDANMREVIRKCLNNGTIVILTTIPPRHQMFDQSKAFADAEKKIAEEMKLPLIDFFGEILKRRPDDWDGAADKFKDEHDGYEVETLIGGDGIHPTYPKKYQGDYTENALKNCGCGLRTYLTLLAYDEVIAKAMK